MLAAYVNGVGPADSMVVGEAPEPVVKPGQVLVRVQASSVNPIDTYLRSGAVAAELPIPYIPGADFAGHVVKLGDGAKRFRVGQRVWGSNQGLLGRQGTLAELVAVDESLAYPTPDGVSDDDAAAMALVGITAHLGLVREAAILPGELLFVRGGSGGVGSCVVQMSKALGAKVITTGGTDEKVARCRALGADLAINYRTQNVAEEIRNAAPGGVNVWWETLRTPNFDEAVGMLAPRGRMIVMAGRDARPEFPVGPFYVKECRLLGFVMFKAPADAQRAAAEAINEWLVDGRLRPQIGATFPLREAAAAHRLQEDNTLNAAGTLTGKIVVRIT